MSQDSVMRAKMKINRIEKFENSETLHLNAVSKSQYSGDGADENNTYAQFTPSADLKITITNPALVGKLIPGQNFYVDFTEAPK